MAISLEMESTEEMTSGPQHNGEDRLSEGSELPNEVADDLVQFFKLLADETRLRIVYLLHQRDELNVQGLCHLLGQSQPGVSHHLALLRVAGLIKMRREGKHNFYRLVPGQLASLVLTMVGGRSGTGGSVQLGDWEVVIRKTPADSN